MSDTPPVRGPIRVTIPVSVAYNIKKFQKSLAVLAERLGCPNCVSGADCLYQIERNYLLDESLQLAGRGSVTEAVPTITASVPSAVSMDLGLLQRAVAAVADKLGACPCTSGYDLKFKVELLGLKNKAVKFNAQGGLV